MRLSISIPTALALASLPILLAAPVPSPHGPGPAHFTKTGALALAQRDAEAADIGIAKAVHNAVDSAQGMSGSTGSDSGKAIDSSAASGENGVQVEHDENTASVDVDKNVSDDNANTVHPDTKADITTVEAPVDTLDTRSITVATTSTSPPAAAFPRVVDSRQRRLKRAPMHLAWLSPKSDIWHTKRNPNNGVGKVMTNAERMANGLAPMPPTKRSTAPHRRSSQVPMTARTNVIVHVVASDGTELGTLAPSDGSSPTDGLLTFGPNPRLPIQFELPEGSGSTLGGGPGAGGSFGPVGPQGNGSPFEIRPRPSGGEDLFGGLGKQLLGAIPHMLGDGELKPSSPNFANLGMGQCDQGNPLNLNLPPLPLVNQVGGLLSGLPQLLGKIPGLLNVNLGGVLGGSSRAAPESGNGNSGAPAPVGGLLTPLGGLGGIGGAGGLDKLGDVTESGLGGLLHIVGPGAGAGSGSDPSSDPTSGTETGDDRTPPSSPTSQDQGAVPGIDEGLLGLHLPSQLLGLIHPSTPSAPGAPAPVTPGAQQGAHSHAEPNTNPSQGFPLDSDRLSQPVSQPAQSAIWSCDERGNMGASWTNPDGSNVPAQFFTGGPCAHTICLAADVEALKGIHGGDLAEVHLVAGLL